MKITKEKVLLILEHESLFRPRKHYCKLVGVTCDTISNWINKGEEIYGQIDSLFDIPSNIEELEVANLNQEQLLATLFHIVDLNKTLSILKTHDAMLKGSKTATKSYIAKNKLLKDPEAINKIIDNIENVPQIVDGEIISIEDLKQYD